MSGCMSCGECAACTSSPRPMRFLTSESVAAIAAVADVRDALFDALEREGRKASIKRALRCLDAVEQHVVEMAAVSAREEVPRG